MAEKGELNSSLAMSVTKAENGILVQMPDLEQSSDTWRARAIDEQRILLFSSDADTGGGASAGLASCPTDVFKDFLLSLVRSSWSGVITVDTGAGIKKIYLSHGHIVFAGSSLIDDRMGEVIYREAKISIDELTFAAAQVTKQQKFGQVLLANGVFTNFKLWEALKLQVLQILRSCFLTDKLYFEFKAGTGLAPTEVLFLESSEDLIGSIFGFGCAFRAFLSRLRAETEVMTLVSNQQIPSQFQPGTFYGDLLEMIKAQPNLQELLNLSKLTDHYTISALFYLSKRGFITLKPSVEVDKLLLPMPGPVIQPLKTAIDTYSYVLALVQKNFYDSKRELPVRDLILLVESMNNEESLSILLDPQGSLSKDAITGMLVQCTSNSARVGYFAKRIESLIQFLLQVAGDNLDFQTAKKIRQEYRSIAF